jgi:hypothetical protein
LICDFTKSDLKSYLDDNAIVNFGHFSAKQVNSFVKKRIDFEIHSLDFFLSMEKYAKYSFCRTEKLNF